MIRTTTTDDWKTFNKMHSIHILSSRVEKHDMQQQQLPQVQATQQQQQQTNEEHNTMTVLESLDPSSQQQVVGLMEQQQQQQQQQPQIVRSHLVQSTSGTNNPNQQPHLHQLQPSQQHSPSVSAPQPQPQQQAPLDSVSNQMSVEEQHLQQQHQHQQQRQHQHQAGRTSGGHVQNNLLRQRPQIEGIVGDAGGPIVQWLMENYEIAEGESLPRSTVYNHYLAHCRHLKMASVNAASFGKLIRSVFVGLKTRRLGTRGHSKYHYFGVRAKPHIRQELLQYQEGTSCSRDMSTTNNENSNQNTDNGSESDSTVNECAGRLSSHSGHSGSKRLKRGVGSDQAAFRRGQHHHHQHQHQHHHQQQAPIYLHQQLDDHDHHKHHQGIELSNNGIYYNNNSNGTNGFEGIKFSGNEHLISSSSSIINNNGTFEQINHCELADFRNYLGANWATLVDENWPQREVCMLEQQLVKSTGDNDIVNNLSVFELRYKSYYKRMVELLSELKFLEIEQLWSEFWHPPIQQPDQQELDWMQVNGSTDQEQQQQQQQNGQHNNDNNSHHNLNYQQQHQNLELSFHQLYQLTSQSIVIEWINHIDYNLYAALESFLLPDMLSPIPRALAQQIRLFAKNIGPWVEVAVKDYEPRFVAEKSKSARAFGYALRRYTSLNHLSTASRAIWEKRSSLAQMSIDLSRVDLRDIEHQVSLMSHTNDTTTTTTTTTITAPTTTNIIGSNLESANLLNNTATNQQLSSVQSNAATITDDNNVVVVATTNNNSNDNETHNRNSNINIHDGASSGHLLDQNHHQSHHNNNNNNDSQHHHPQHLCVMQPAQLIQNFLHLLEDPYPANSWPDWCRNLVESRVCGLSIEEARNFVLKWNFYISLIMKELTLRSAPSFGSFQLIRLLFDEYIFYLVVTRVAQAQQRTPAQLLNL